MWDLLFPIQCVECQAYDFWLCPDCTYKLCTPKRNRLQQYIVTSAANYHTPVVQSLLHRYKYSGMMSVANTFNGWLNAVIDWKTVDYVVPVPLHWRKRLQRGFSQTERIIQHCPKPWLPALRKVRSTAAQATLNRSERQQNLKNAFVVKPHYERYIANHRILLVDDVLSTGSTVLTCANVLQQAGATVQIAVLARNELR